MEIPYQIYFFPLKMLFNLNGFKKNVKQSNSTGLRLIHAK